MPAWIPRSPDQLPGQASRGMTRLGYLAAGVIIGKRGWDRKLQIGQIGGRKGKNQSFGKDGRGGVRAVVDWGTIFTKREDLFPYLIVCSCLLSRRPINNYSKSHRYTSRSELSMNLAEIKEDALPRLQCRFFRISPLSQKHNGLGLPWDSIGIGRFKV